jgi:micrococcal nuclease
MTAGISNGFSMTRRFLLLLACGLVAAGTSAAPPASILRAQIQKVQADGTLILTDNRTALLEGLVFPDPAVAAAWLARLNGRSVSYHELGVDRYGRIRMIATDSGRTIQQAMIHDGAALIYGTGADAAWVKEEGAARKNRRGVWQQVLISPANAPDALGQFRVVEGKVTRVYAAREATYLNFGDDWKTDFSVTVPKRLLRKFGTTLDAIEGKTVRVRGIIVKENGAMIEINQPEQLEVIHAGT